MCDKVLAGDHVVDVLVNCAGVALMGSCLMVSLERTCSSRTNVTSVRSRFFGVHGQTNPLHPRHRAPARCTARHLRGDDARWCVCAHPTLVRALLIVVACIGACVFALLVSVFGCG